MENAGTKRSSVCREVDDAREGTIYNAVDCFQQRGQSWDSVRSIRKLLLGLACGALGAGVVHAQAAGALNAPSPFVRPKPEQSEGTVAMAVAAAQRAHDIG